MSGRSRLAILWKEDANRRVSLAPQGKEHHSLGATRRIGRPRHFDSSRGGASGYGTVFEVTPDGTETVLHSFTGGTDGSYPAAGLLRDAKGNLYGTTTGGGSDGYGTVFRVTMTGTETVLHSFTGSDGYYPIAGLVKDANGNLYGTTEFGGSHGSGTVFKVTRTGTETLPGTPLKVSDSRPS